MTSPVPPPSIAVGVHRYSVATDAAVCEDLRSEVKRGTVDPDRLLIRVDVSAPFTLTADTLLHEILHACWNQTPLRERDEDDEERTVTALTPLLLGVLRDNPDLVAYLTA